MLIPWADMQDILLAEVPGCSSLSAANALRLAAQRFCEGSHAWRAQLDPLYTAEDVDTYDFNISLEQEVVKVAVAKLDGRKLTPLLYEHWDGQTPGIVVLNQREFQLQPTPAAGLTLEVTAVLKPSNTAVGIEDFLYAMHKDTLNHGAKAELFGMKNQPFTDLMAAADERALFDVMVGRAQTRAAQAYSSAPLRVKASFL